MVRRDAVRLAALGLGLGLCVLASCLIGRYPLAPGRVWEMVARGELESMDGRVLTRIRLPRTLLVACCGAALALSGCVFQAVFRNPLVSPDVLGVSGGSAVGAALCILGAGGGALVSLCAFLGGMAAMLAAALLARAIGGLRNQTLLLSGIVVGALANALLMAVKYVADPAQQLAAIEYWLMGGFHNATAENLRVTLRLMALPVAALWLLRRQLALLALGDDDAACLGVRVARVKLACVSCATLLAASVVAVAGAVSWVGLIVPHLVRIARHRDAPALCEAALCGAVLLLAADMLARSVSAAEIPISILTSLMGAALLAGILIRRGGKYGRDAHD